NLITSKSDLVGLNEVAGRYSFLRDWAANNGWHFYAPDPNHARNEALLARKSMFDVVSRGSVFACDTNGPGEVPPARYTNWVRYLHKPTGRYVHHINAHANAHIDNNGHPYDLPRTDCAEKQFRDIKALATSKQDSGQVVVSGDLNVDFVDDRRVQYVNFPWRVFEDNALPNLRSTYNILGVKGTGTLGSRHIDYIYFWKRVPEHQKMWLTDYSIVTGTESDHNGLVATFAISVPA
ncbi:MAG: endonuclease/exonuclease/phosphatase family protein, partial [Micromonosporaceae bacterium]